MEYNKVVYGNNTLIDLTSDTVTPQTLAVGETAHNAAGETITGASIGTAVVASITFPLAWNDSGSGYYTVTPTVSGATITAASKVNLQPAQAQILQLQSDGVTALYIENNNGVLTAYAVGNAPTTAMTMQCTVEAAVTAADPLSSLTYSTAGLEGNIDITSGGYCKVGKLVVVNIRGTTTASVSPGNTLLTGLPNPEALISGNVMAVASNLDFPFFLTAGGNISTPSSGAGGSSIASGATVMFSVTYISAS